MEQEKTHLEILEEIENKISTYLPQVETVTVQLNNQHYRTVEGYLNVIEIYLDLEDIDFQLKSLTDLLEGYEIFKLRFSNMSLEIVILID
jgi:hypothetical protein